MKTNIRTSKLSTEFVNKNKQEELLKIFNEYKRITQEFINYYWCLDLENLPKLCSAEDYNKIDSFLSSSLKQTAGKQALGIIRDTFQKQKQRNYKCEKLKEESNKLKKVVDNINISCPEVKNLEMEIDETIALINFENKNTSFDGWVTLSSLFSEEYLEENPGLKKIQIPLKRTKHFNSLMDKGQLENNIIISPIEITFRFEIEKKEKT